MGATLRQTVVAAIQGLLTDSVTQYGPLAPQGPALSPVGVGVAPNQAISKQEIYEAMCRRRANWNFTDGSTIGTGVAEEPVYCVPSVISAQGIATGVSQGFTVKQFWVESLVALASGITYGSAGWTVTISKRSPSITGQGAAVIASATTQTGDPALGAGSNAFQPVSVPISGAGVATTIGAASFSQAITAATPFTLTVASTAGFPPQGAGYVTNTSGVLVPFSYTGIGFGDHAHRLPGLHWDPGRFGAPGHDRGLYAVLRRCGLQQRRPSTGHDQRQQHRWFPARERDGPRVHHDHARHGHQRDRVLHGAHQHELHGMRARCRLPRRHAHHGRFGSGAAHRASGSGRCPHFHVDQGGRRSRDCLRHWAG